MFWRNPSMRREFATRPGKRFMLFLMTISMLATPGWSQQLPPEKTVFVLEYKESYTRAEVEALVEEILRIAEEEIERTANEAAREAAGEEAGEAAYWKAVADQKAAEVADLRLENLRLERQGKGKTAGLWIAGALTLVFGSIIAVEHSR
jgi:hypothetical protein